MRKVVMISAVALMFASCRPSVSVTSAPTPGTAVFTNYLAIGDNYAGGFMNGNLQVSGQYNSYPIRLFEQFQLIPGNSGAKGPFVQPVIHSDNGYPTAKLILGMWRSSCDPLDTSLAPILFPNFVADPEDAKPYVSAYNNGQINNIGVMGIRVADLPVVGYAMAAAAQGLPFAQRFYNDPSGTPQQEIEHRVNNLYPTFFTVSMGMNDVLLYALNGGQGDGTGHALPIALNIYNPNDITPFPVFDTQYNKMVDAATITGASGALLNVPDITSLPYFTTIAIDGMELDRQGQADTLMAYWNTKGVRTVLQPGRNLFIVEDHLGHARQAVPGELILMSVPLDSIKCKGWGTTKAIPDIYVLTTDEIQFIRDAVKSYNEFIKFVADRRHLAYVDLNSFFKTLAAGTTFNGVLYNTQFIMNGTFSLDGIHPTQRGYAMIANEVLKTVNAFYGSTVPQIDVNKYKGIEFP